MNNLVPFPDPDQDTIDDDCTLSDWCNQTLKRLDASTPNLNADLIYMLAKVVFGDEATPRLLREIARAA